MSLFKSRKNQSELPPRRRRVAASSGQSSEASTQLFRRNRTLTGSSSSRFGSANEDHANLKSPRASAHELAKKRRKILRYLAGSFAGFLILVAILWQMIVGVAVYSSDVSVDDPDPYEAAINNYLLRHPLQRFRFALDESALTRYVSGSQPEVKTIELSQPFGPASSRFEVSLRRPVAEWSVGGEVRYVDNTGVAFERNYYSKPNIQIIDNSGIDSTSNAALASGRFLGFVGHIVRLSDSLSYTPTDITIPPATTRQLEVSYESLGYPVKFSIDRPAGEQVEDMDRAVKYLNKTNTKPRYLDVRVSGRAFYR